MAQEEGTRNPPGDVTGIWEMIFAFLPTIKKPLFH